jgi:transcriptional regulator with XRE-family HTH domain
MRFISIDESKKENMLENIDSPLTAAPLHVFLRQRRQTLNLLQAEIAEALDVTPECVGMWECGRRRMELNKVPRLAAALDIDPKELCARVLKEFYPTVYATIFDGAMAGMN